MKRDRLDEADRLLNKAARSSKINQALALLAIVLSVCSVVLLVMALMMALIWGNA